jgi:hypothetical protein
MGYPPTFEPLERPGAPNDIYEGSPEPAPAAPYEPGSWGFPLETDWLRDGGGHLRELGVDSRRPQRFPQVSWGGRVAR